MNDDALRHLFAVAKAFKEGDVAVGETRDDDVRGGAGICRCGPAEIPRYLGL
jgi:hypothetical protein